jgi:hypothetical protein
MPNWCSNEITIRHPDPAMIDRVIRARDGLLMEFFPTPQELLDTVAGWPGEDQQAAHETQKANNLEKYGYRDWYEWNIANWGTKWDVSFDGIERTDENTVQGHFESAWSPPTAAYEQLLALGFEIEASYYEPGMCFVGSWDNGQDRCYNYGESTSASVRHAIGAELDDQWGISREMAQYEQEAAEE